MADKAGKNTLNFYKNSPDFSHGVGGQNKRPMTLHGRYRYVPFGVLCLISGLELLADLDLWLGCQCLVVAQFVGLRGECLGLHQNSLTRCKRKC